MQDRLHQKQCSCMLDIAIKILTTTIHLKRDKSQTTINNGVQEFRLESFNVSIFGHTANQMHACMLNFLIHDMNMILICAENWQASGQLTRQHINKKTRTILNGMKLQKCKKCCYLKKNLKKKGARYVRDTSLESKNEKGIKK